MARQVQRSAYMPADMSEEVDEFLEDSEYFDSFSEMVRYSLRETMQFEEIEQ